MFHLSHHVAVDVRRKGLWLVVHWNPPGGAWRVIGRVIATSPSKWIKTPGPKLATFSWQAGYGGFSVSESNVPKVANYIRNQQEHHRVKTFQEEYREFLSKHKIQYDERYVWD